eukprot:SAG31_NODE_389_length_16370_cov_4.517915_13_plen_130_part_00
MMGNYNIWYGKYESQEGRRAYARGIGEVAETRCVTATDVGRTRGSANPSAFICYLFAQGRCHNVSVAQFCDSDEKVPDGAACANNRVRNVHFFIRSQMNNSMQNLIPQKTVSDESGTRQIVTTWVVSAT